MNNNSNLHVIFGTGPLGKSVMRALVGMGKPVRMVSRSGRASVPAGVEVVAADAYNVNQVKDVTRDAAVVYQCAQPEYHEWAEKFPPLQASILEGTAASGARLIVGDNLYMYGDTNGQPIHEDLPYRPNTRKGKVRAAMAEAVLAAHRAGKVRAALVRGSDFFGPEVLGSSLGERVFYPLLAGKPAQLGGDPNALHSYTYISDFGTALALVGERDDALGQVWHVPNVEALPQRAYVELFAELAGVEPKVTAISRMMMRLAGLFIVGARESVEMMYEFEKPFIVDSSKFERAFGMRATPLREAMQATLDWYRANPQPKSH